MMAFLDYGWRVELWWQLETFFGHYVQRQMDMTGKVNPSPWAEWVICFLYVRRKEAEHRNWERNHR